MNKPLSFLKRNTSTILTCVGAVGVVATSVMAVKATPKAMLLLEEAEKEKREELTKVEVIKTAVPVYIPAIAMGAATIACVLGSNVFNKRSQASIISAYALLERSYKEYGDKVKELYGAEVDRRAKEEIAKEHYEGHTKSLPEGTHLFFDMVNMEYFEANMDDVLQKVVMDDGLECYIITSPFDSGRPAVLDYI